MKKNVSFVLILCALAVWLFSVFVPHVIGRRPFKKLTEDQIVTAGVYMASLDHAVEITDIRQLIAFLNDVVIYQKDSDATFSEEDGDGVTFTLHMHNGIEKKVTADDPYVFIDGVGYRCKKEPCQALAGYAGSLLEMAAEEREQTDIGQREDVSVQPDTEPVQPNAESEAVAESEAAAEDTDSAREILIHFSDTVYSVQEAANAAVPYGLTMIAEQENGISDVQEWFGENELTLPMLGYEWMPYLEQNEDAVKITEQIRIENHAFYDESYVYDWTEQSLNIYERESGRLLYTILYQSDRWYLMGNCASLIDGILYIGNIYNGYAMPGTCFLLAYDIENESVLWRSQDQTYNTMNFIVKDDVIICGYGFTAEGDYLYQIDRFTGEVIAQTELKKMPDLLVEKDGKLYVHTYSYDYIFDMGRPLSDYDTAERVKDIIASQEERAGSIEETLKNTPLTQTEMNEQARQLYEIWDSALNHAWDVLYKTLEEKQKDELLVQQRAWIAQKEKEIQDAAEEYEGGSMQPMVRDLKAAELTRARVYELAELLEPGKES